MAVNNRFETTESGHIPSPWDKIGFLIWVAIFGLTMGLFMVAFFDHIKLLIKQPNGPIHWYLLPLNLNLISALAFAGVSAILALRRHNNWMAWITAVMLITMGLGLINPILYILPSSRPELATLNNLIGAIAGLSFSYFLYTFPQGYFSSAKVAVVGITAMIWFTLTNGLLEVMNWVDMATLYDTYLIFLATMSFILYGAPLAIRAELRQNALASTAAADQQVKLIGGGLSIALAGYVVSALRAVSIASLTLNEPTVLIINLIGDLLLTVALTALPVTIGLAMMRYRLWDVDFLINRSLVYGALTVLLAVLVVIELIVFQWFLRLITGEEQVTVALIIAAMISGGLFQPTRRWLQRFIDRQLYGIHISYDTPKKQDEAGQTAVYPSSSQQQLGPYEVQELIGQGGMAEVYKGRHATLNRTVAIKMMRTDRADQSDFRTRFEREAQAIAQLRHPNIIEIFDFGLVNSTYYMVMAYIAGQSLSDYLQANNGRISHTEALAYLSHIASALDYAHAQNIVHRDIKPSNVMLQPQTTVTGRYYSAVLTDFGIAKIRGGGTAITRTGMVGTLDYIAPEQIQDARDVDGRADVYSLGVMAYQLLAGQLPFQGSNPAAILIAHMQQTPPDPRKFNPDLSETAVTAIYKAMAKTPSERFGTAGELAAALHDG